MESIHRAYKDTKESLWSLYSGALTGFITLVAFYYFRGEQEALREATTYIFTVFGMFLGVVLSFCWNFILAPYRIQKDRAIKAEDRIAELESGNKIPNVVIKGFDFVEGQNNHLAQTLTALAYLFRQYQTLLKAVKSNRTSRINKDSYDELDLITEFIGKEAAKILPNIPYGPEKPLILVTGWNSYRYIFNQPMRIAPTVTFPSLPEEIEYRILRVSKIDFEVSFYHLASHNDQKVEPQSFAACAELTE